MKGTAILRERKQTFIVLSSKHLCGGAAMTTTDGLEEKNKAHIYNIVRKIDDTAEREPRNETNSPRRNDTKNDART